MKKIIKLLLVVAMACSLTSVSYATEKGIEPRVLIEACNGSSNYIVSVSSEKKELYERTGRYVGAGNSATISTGVAYSVSNSANLSILPELLSMGFSSTVSVDASWSDTLNNTTSYMREVGVFRVYKTVTYTSYSYVGGGNCEVRPGRTMKVYTGWVLDFF